MRWAVHVAHMGRRGMRIWFWWENQKERGHWEGLCIGGRINLNLIGIVGVESNLVHLALRPPMAYCASPGWLWWWRNLWNDWQGKLKYSEKTCPSAALSTRNPTCCPDANPGRPGGKPASNRLSYGTASGGRIMLEAEWGGMNWFCLAQGRDQ
jgi:hypothetical protein